MATIEYPRSSEIWRMGKEVGLVVTRHEAYLEAFNGYAVVRLDLSVSGERPDNFYGIIPSDFFKTAQRATPRRDNCVTLECNWRHVWIGETAALIAIPPEHYGRWYSHASLQFKQEAVPAFGVSASLLDTVVKALGAEFVCFHVRNSYGPIGIKTDYGRAIMFAHTLSEKKRLWN